MKTTKAARLMRASVTDSGAQIFEEEIAGFSIDSRTTGPGELFFALSPEDYTRHGFNGTSFADAHHFIPQAFACGAIAAVARRERALTDEELRPFRDRLWLVEDVIAALQSLAHNVLEVWGRPVIGITGGEDTSVLIARRAERDRWTGDGSQW